MSSIYTVRIKGVQNGKEINQVLEKLSLLFKSTPDKLRPLLLSGNLVAKKSVDLETAEKYQKAITNAGCVVEIEEELEFEKIPELLVESQHPTDTKYCSSCGHKNISKARFCEGCGESLGDEGLPRRNYVTPVTKERKRKKRNKKSHLFL